MTDIILPAPRKEGGMSLREALSKRCSTRSYSSRPLPLQTLSNLLWAGWGFSHANGKLRTAPSSHNRQEMTLFVMLPEGVYTYDAKSNKLLAWMDKDLRSSTCMQEYATVAPVQIVLVSETAKVTGKTPQGVIESIYANAGYISENLYLAAAAEGLVTVARAMVPKEDVERALGLAQTQKITLVQTVGYAPEPEAGISLFRKMASYIYFTLLRVSGWRCPETTDTIEVNGQRLFYSVRGPMNGKPVVLMHGNGGSHKSMTTQQIQLAKAGYRVYCPDSRGQGANKPLEEYHYADMAEDCYCFIKALGLEKPVVGGWSDGGINVLLLEMAHPGTCSLIVAAGANLYPECCDDFEGFKAWVLEQGTPLALMMIHEPHIEPSELSAIACPALITCGSKEMITVAHTKLIADSIPDSELEVFEGDNHGSYIKRDPRFGRRMLEFLASHGY
ncbi:MAG: alpha/beta fold hydrolase [Bacteroidales bacterium]|nr:alpha/beta fold hydrolase [Candidatus Cacconaster merdequi]